VNAVSDITPDSLLAARAVKPQPGESETLTNVFAATCVPRTLTSERVRTADLLIIGCGDKIMQLPEATLEAFRNSETLLEVLDTVSFNSNTCVFSLLVTIPK
jgi:hypothetical protein